jgi:CRP/FNR family transcriptional regulator
MVTSADGTGTSSGRAREFLARVPFLAYAPPALRTAFVRAADVVRLEAGAYFLHEGDPCAHFAVLVSGRIRVFKFAESGHEITLYSVGPGEACPLSVSCLLSSRPVPAMAKVVEPVEAIIIPARTFRTMIAQHEALRSYVFLMLSARLSEVMSLVEEVAFVPMDERLAYRLVKLLGFANGPRRSVETTHAELAADLGTAREVVSRLLKRFEHLGAIALSRGRIEIRDARPLRAMVRCQSD